MAKDTRISARLDSDVFQMLSELIAYYEKNGMMGTVNSSQVINEAIKNLYVIKIQADSTNNDVYLDVMKTQIEETMKPIAQRLLMETDAMVERVYLAQKLMLGGMNVEELGEAQKIKKNYLDGVKEFEKAIELKINDRMEAE